MLIDTPSGTRIQYHTEVAGATVDTQTGPFLDLDGHDVAFTLIADPTTQRIEASYQVDGGATTSFEHVVAPPEFFSFDAARIPRMAASFT